MLGLSDLAGHVGIAQLPGYDNLLGGDEEQLKYAPGMDLSDVRVRHELLWPPRRVRG